MIYDISYMTNSKNSKKNLSKHSRSKSKSESYGELVDIDLQFYPEGLTKGIKETWTDSNVQRALARAMEERKREKELDEEGPRYRQLERLDKSKAEKNQLNRVIRLLQSYKKRNEKRMLVPQVNEHIQKVHTQRVGKKSKQMNAGRRFTQRRRK